ncbi:MAG: glycoside hydrolase family 97 catalytic domain-containing protein [Bacteroidaceae bacterium]|nr:glycoside hydrolase family 97 catalytic domain-containing protein [Bacteroidaceae bacterium]
MTKKTILLASALIATSAFAQQTTVYGPDSMLRVDIDVKAGKPVYSVKYDGKTMLDESPLGLKTNIGDFTQGMKYVKTANGKIEKSYTMDRSKFSHVDYKANEAVVSLTNAKGHPMDICFRVSNNDIAFQYRIAKRGETGSIRIMGEATGFDFPSHTTTFLTPQSDPMIGWKRTKPSYEEEYKFDAPMTEKSQYGHGYTFPGLFHIGNDGWVLVSETGVGSNYCGTRLSDMKGDGLYTIELPMPGENNGNGTIEPAFALPGATPWRTITVGSTLTPIVETTAPWDNVEPLYTTANKYKFGRGTWSWIVWQDNSINFNDQKEYVDLAAKMGFEYVLVDNWWDTNIKKTGKNNIEDLIKYAQSKGVDVFLWYSSSGYWNDIVQGPINRMDNPIIRKAEMRWMKSLGVKGIKVDFFGGDKQETMRLYEQILSDADDNGLMVIFHGCTLPRGWEKMYPNYVGSEAVLASENMVFQQHFCDEEARVTALHPFCRNAVGVMEFGGCFMNRRLAKGNKSGTTRRTTDCHELATTILFQNPIQNFAITPENLLPESEGGAPKVSMDFLREVPTVWDETRHIDGYPGKYIVLARRHGQTWYIAATNATKEPMKLTLDLSGFVQKGDIATLYSDNAKTREPQKSDLKIRNAKKVTLTILPDGGAVIVK